MEITMRNGVFLGILAFLSCLPAEIAAIEGAVRTPVLLTPHFAFYSDLATNINDALIATGIERKFDRQEIFQTNPEALCFEKLPPSARAGWNYSVDYYQEFISPAKFNDRAQYLLRMNLAEHDEQIRGEGSKQFIGTTRGFMDAASTAFSSCRWATQDKVNRQWIEQAESLLVQHEERIAGQLAKLYQKSWGGLPIPADIVETVSWSGANSIAMNPDGGHLLISNSYLGNSALEIVFHEASHLLMGRNDPVWQALEKAAAALDMQMPDGIWHVVLFYTTGEIVRASLEAAGEPVYTPMIYEIYTRSPWGRYQEAVESTWPAYLNGELTLSEATTNLITAIGNLGE